MSITLKSNVDGSSTLQNNGVDIINVSNTNTVSIPQNITLNNTTLNGTVSAPLAAQFSNNANVATTEFVQRAMGNLSSVTYTGTRTLTAADAGKLSGIATSGTVLTLPVGSTLPAGASFHFWNGTSAGTGTVQRQGSDVIYLADNSVTSVGVNGGESLSLMWSGTAWYAIAGSSTLGKASSSFGSSLATNGYQKLPSGLIIQWGISAATTTSVTVTFPIAFPNAILRLLENDFGVTTDKTIWSASSVTNTGLTANNLGRLTKGSTTFNASINSAYPWFAIGY